MRDKILLGKRIKYFRSLLAINQEEFAYRMNMGLTTISKVERGVIDVPFTRLCQMAKVLKVSLPELVDIHKSRNN